VTHTKLKHAGIDVSATELHVAIEGRDKVWVGENNAEGHKKLLKTLTKGAKTVRVVVEATSTYHLDLALALDDHKRCEVMVANPRATNHFHQAQGVRAKTDKVDARSLLTYAMRMDFVPWIRPAEHLLTFRQMARYVSGLVKQQTRLKNQLSSAKSFSGSSEFVLSDLQDQLEQLGVRIEKAKGQASEFAKAHADIYDHVQNLETIPGIGEDTAVRLLAELLFLDEEMTSKQVTAWAGLDPRPKESGTSVRGRRPISKRGNSRVRGALYWSAVTAGTRCKGPLKAFYGRVHERSGRKKVAVTAVMRRLLVIAWAMYRSGSKWEPALAAPRVKVELAA
jgi:transposase